jgi:predicted RNA polymerase sigma factor
MSPAALPAGAERALRELAPRVLCAVLRRCPDFGAAEDAVQDALLAAIGDWPARGVPENPAGWLYRAALRRLGDRARSEAARVRREEASALARREDPGPDAPAMESTDDSLLLLFMCCHPALTEASAIALTLRAVGGLTTEEIARAFLVPPATMAQRISRAKHAIDASGIRFAEPPPAERARCLSSVLHVLYLIFNEGYASSAGDELLRVDLSAEAIRLARLLARAEPADAEVAGLLALMLLTDARRAARRGPEGDLIPLDEQDRALWDRAAIDEGTRVVRAAITKGAVGSYQIQAAIAALHGEAPSVDATDWAQILALYELLRRMQDNPMVALNHAVAAAMVHGPDAGLSLLDAVAADERVRGHHRLAAVRAHLLERRGDRSEAVAQYMAAARATASLPERRYLLARAERLSGPGRGSSARPG